MVKVLKKGTIKEYTTKEHKEGRLCKLCFTDGIDIFPRVVFAEDKTEQITELKSYKFENIYLEECTTYVE